MTERVVLAYSGGLDTSVAIGWIAEQTGAEVVALAVDVGSADAGGGAELALSLLSDLLLPQPAMPRISTRAGTTVGRMRRIEACPVSESIFGADRRSTGAR